MAEEAAEEAKEEAKEESKEESKEEDEKIITIPSFTGTRTNFIKYLKKELTDDEKIELM